MTTLERLYAQAEADGIAVSHFRLPKTVSCALVLNGKYYIGIDKKQLSTSYEEAECLAHEIGHCHTDAFYTVGEKNRRRAEKKAEEWAITHLVSPARFQNAIQNGCRELWEFAEEFGTSCAFAEKVIRYYLARASM